MSAVTPKIIISVISFLLIISATLGLLSSYRVDALRADVANANAARDAAEHRRVTQETELKTRETAVAEGEAKIAEAEKKIAELAQLQEEKTELQAKLEANRNEIASLQKRIEEGGAATKSSENPSAASAPASAPQQQFTPLPPSLEIKPGGASTPEQPTSSPSPPEIKPEHVEETTPPARQPKRQKIAASKTPQVAGSSGGAMSISSARALAIYAPKPEYPPEIRARQITGSGVCVVDVDPGSGNVTEASMAQSTGNKILDESAVRTFGKWRFKPGTVSRVRIPIEFR